MLRAPHVVRSKMFQYLEHAECRIIGIPTLVSSQAAQFVDRSFIAAVDEEFQTVNFLQFDD